MATGVPQGFRPIATLACAAAYVDAEGTILFENDGFRALHPVQAAGASPQRPTLGMLVVESDRETVAGILAAPRRQLRRMSCALSVAGSHAPMLAEFVPIRRKSRAGIVWLVMLRPSQDAPEPAAELVSRAEVTAGIVHDLKAPVQVVLGWASLLRRQHDDPERIEHALMIIERNAELMMDLLADLLAQTRPSSTHAPAPRREMDLAQLVRAEVRAVQPLAEASGVSLSLRVDSPAIAVVGDEVHLRRVVINLLGNALKFTPRGGKIECCLGRSGGWASLAVRDTGAGIGREFLPRVFDAYVQEPGHAQRSEEGLGLGLAIVRHLVELHGGAVAAASAGDGRGATFTVLLPAVLRTLAVPGREAREAVARKG